MANGFYRNEIEHAIYSIRGYYLPTPHEEITEKHEAAFERARTEAIEAYQKMIAALESITYEQFAKTHNKPWRIPFPRRETCQPS